MAISEKRVYSPVVVLLPLTCAPSKPTVRWSSQIRYLKILQVMPVAGGCLKFLHSKVGGARSNCLLEMHSERTAATLTYGKHLS